MLHKKLILLSLLLLISSCKSHAEQDPRVIVLCAVFGAVAYTGLKFATTTNEKDSAYEREGFGVILFTAGILGILGSKGMVSIWDKPNSPSYSSAFGL